MNNSIPVSAGVDRLRWLAVPAGAEARAWIISLTAVVTAWMLGHPYLGIYHDAVLYAYQALNWLDPATYGNDLFFRFGSQDDYTVFTPIYAPLVDALGLPAAAKLVTILAHLLWLSGAVALVLGLLRDRVTVTFTLLLIVSLPAFHSGLTILAYGEGFATPRVFVEAATLWAFWLLISRRNIAALAVLGVGTALHPLYGAVGFGAALLYLVQGDRRWSLAILFAPVAAVGLAVAGISPFDRLFVTLDGAWLELARDRNTMVFSLLWVDRDWARLILAAFTVSVGIYVVPGTFRRFAIAVLAAAAGGMLATIIGADLLHNAFLTQIQLYRANWMLQLFAHISAGVLLVRLWRQGDNALPLTALLVAGWLASWLLPVHYSLLALAATALIGLQLRYHLKPFSGVGIVVCLICFVIVTMITVSGLAVSTIEVVELFLEERFAWYAAYTHLMLPEGIVIAMVLFFGLRLRRDTARPVTLVAALALAVAVAGTWDRRSDFARDVEAGRAVPSLAERLPPDATIIWETNAYMPWLGLRRPSYLTWQSSSGAVFSHDFSMEYLARARRLESLETNILDQFLTFLAKDGPPEQIDRSALVDACRNVPELDYMFLHRKVEGAYIDRAILRGSTPPPNPDGDPVSYMIYLYDCAALRPGSGT